MSTKKGGRHYSVQERSVVKQQVVEKETVKQLEKEGAENLKQRDVIKNLLVSIQDLTRQLTKEAEESSKSSEVFSNNAQSQAASAEEITSTVEEMTAGAKGRTNIKEFLGQHTCSD